MAFDGAGEIKADFDVQRAIFEVGAARNPLEALEAFKRNISTIGDWRIVYAAEESEGPFKLRRHQFSSKGFVSTIFRGQSLWILDREAVSSPGYIEFCVGSATFVDSNAASFVESLAYQGKPSAVALEFCKVMSDYFSMDELSRINPYLYLWEAQRDKSAKQVSAVRRTIAALHAISLIQRPLDITWGETFRTHYRDEAEAYADNFLSGFYRQMDHAGDKIEREVDVMEAMLVRTMIIEYSSNKSGRHKLEALVQFMHDELSTIMGRELIVCADILCRSGESQISEKLNALFDRKDPFAVIRNCARDLNLLRTMDRLSNTHSDASLGAFYIANLITFDRDLADILRLAELRAIALHRSSSKAFPIYNELFFPWLSSRVGEKRMAGLEDLFSMDGFNIRAMKRSRGHIEAVLKDDREKLAALLVSKRATRADRARFSEP